MSPNLQRFQPIALPAARRIGRPRLTRLLAQRFEARVTLLTASAGHGKSTALAEAVANNELDPMGIDIWLAATPPDRDPTHLLAGLARSLDLEPLSEVDDALEAVVGRIWAHAPRQVVLIIDDAHHLDSTEAVATLRSLLDRLPTNGHLVLAGRQALPLPLGRLDSLGDAIRIGPDDLLFDPTELAALAESRDGQTRSVDGIPRLPALADLQLRADPSVGRDYLWEEVLAALGPERLDALTRVAVLDQFDDEMVGALTDGRFRSDELVSDLPMVEPGLNGRFRLHSLLRDALLERADDRTTIEAGRQAARIELDRERLPAAARLLATIGDVEPALDVIRRFAALPLLRAPLDETADVVALAGELAPGSLTLHVLQNQYGYGRYDRTRVDRFVDLARRARDEGDDELEALAIHRATQGVERRGETLPGDLVERITALAQTNPVADAIAAHIESMEAMRRGDGEEGLRLLARFGRFDPAARPVLLAERQCELGNPELVDPGLGADQLGRLPPGTDTFVGYAMWLRGEAAPEVALVLVDDMIPRAAQSSHRYGALATLSVGSHVAVAAGQLDLARQWATTSADLAAGPVAPDIEAYARVAGATVAFAAEDGSDEARAATDDALARLLALSPIGNWPSLAYLMALPLVYSRRPETRPALDRCRFGPALVTAVAAGRALAALDEHGGGDEAAALPWSEEALLRVHVPPNHLARLAAAAAEAGHARAADLIERLPDARSLLDFVAGDDLDPASGSLASDGPAGRRWARDRLAAFPPPAPPPVTVLTIGPLRIEGAPSDGDDPWRRARVRELLAYLVEHRSVSRAEVAAALWPDLTEAKSAANLRVNLNHLSRALEPGRTGEAPGHIVVDGSRLTLGHQVTVDVDVFDAVMAEARSLDQGGAPAAALPLYRQAAAMVDGRYLEEFDADWVLPTRMRLRAAAIEAWCRVGELTLARGEPEEATGWATRAVRDSPTAERAGRLLISAYVAMDARPAALEAAERLLDHLTDADLEPEPATARLIGRLRHQA